MIDSPSPEQTSMQRRTGIKDKYIGKEINMAQRNLNQKQYQAKQYADRLNGTLCSKPVVESGVPQSSSDKKIESVEVKEEKKPRSRKKEE